jgi:hypothetical protein
MNNPAADEIHNNARRYNADAGDVGYRIRQRRMRNLVLPEKISLPISSGSK